MQDSESGWRVWVVKSPNCNGFPTCNIFYRREDASKFAAELKRHVGGQWKVLRGNITVEAR